MTERLAVDCGSQEALNRIAQSGEAFSAPHGEALFFNKTGGARCMYAYCLFCETQRCGVVAHRLEQKGADRAFSPQIISRERKQGKMEECMYDLFPGYVFVFMEKPLENYEFFSGIQGIIRCLGDEQRLNGLTNGDYSFAMSLYQKNGVVGAIPALKEGEQIRILDPMFQGYNGTILQIDHRKQRAKVQFRFDNRSWTVWVACDVLYKDDATEQKQ